MPPKLKLLLAVLAISSSVVILYGTVTNLTTTDVHWRRRRPRVILDLPEIRQMNVQSFNYVRLQRTWQNITAQVTTSSDSLTTPYQQEITYSSSSTNPPYTSKPRSVLNSRRYRWYTPDPLLVPRSRSAPCKDEICYQDLSPAEKVQFKQCSNKTRRLEWKFGPVSNGSCRFMATAEIFPVALVSFPGSGNTWVRGLLEKATGICTGALYCDGALRNSGFTGEGVRGPSTLVVKTHGPSARFPGRRRRTDLVFFRAAIFLVRNLRDSLVAEWNREKSKTLMTNTTSNHYLYVGKEYFGNNEDWNNYIELKGARWLRQIGGWLTLGKDYPILVVRYEDLKADTLGQVERMLDFLGVPYTEKEIKRRLGEGFPTFYRNHTDSFEHFTPYQRVFIEDVVDEAVSVLKRYGVEGVMNFDGY